MKVALLRSVPLFATLPETELHLLASTLPERHLRAGETLLREGDHGGAFYVIVQGEIEIVRGLETRNPELLATHGPTEIVGEFALLSEHPARTASVRALSDVTALEVSRAAFDALLVRNPFLAYPMMSHLASRLHEAHSTALQVLLAAQDEVVRKRSLERELELARSIQMRMIPREMPGVRGFGFGARLVPMTQVGGDFFDFLQLVDGRIGVVIGDVSGHGVSAALIMSVTMALIRLEAEQNESPAEVLRNVNRQLTRISGGETFVTALYGVLDPASGQFVYCRAGHEPPVFVVGGMTHVVESRGGFLLGLLPEIAFHDQKIDLATGSRLVCYTDGVTEARNVSGAFFGLEGLLRLLEDCEGADAQELSDSILSAVEAHTAGLTQQDDITVLCIKVAGG